MGGSGRLMQKNFSTNLTSEYYRASEMGSSNLIHLSKISTLLR
jgi:hypothetical protein